MPRILLVDDQEELLLLLQATFEEGNYETIDAQCGSEALALVRSEQPDLVVMDWMMPGMTGIEVMRELKADPRTSSIPVILLTARNQAEDRAAGAAAGVNAYLSKPFSPAELLRRAELLLSSS